MKGNAEEMLSVALLITMPFVLVLIFILVMLLLIATLYQVRIVLILSALEKFK